MRKLFAGKAVMIITAIAAFLAIPFILFFVTSRLWGGELYKPDFKNGYDVYVAADVSGSLSASDFSLVRNESEKAAILNTCLKLKCCREVDGLSDIMLGSSDEGGCDAAVFFVAVDHGYKIFFIDWSRYRPGAWGGWPIKEEM